MQPSRLGLALCPQSLSPELCSRLLDACSVSRDGWVLVLQSSAGRDVGCLGCPQPGGDRDKP